MHKNFVSSSPGHLFATTLIIAAGLCLASCHRSEWRVAEGAVWNTTYRIVYQAPANLDDSIAHILREIEMSLSPFNPSSRISRINCNETDRTDAIIDTVFRMSQQVNMQSGHRFDPTVSPLVNLWGFGYDKSARKNIESDTMAPDTFSIPQNRIDSALALVGICECHIEAGIITKKHPGTTFNFSAITKGYACDLIAEMLNRNGSCDNMVEIGGEIALTGHNREGKPWKIQIDAPVESANPVHTPLLTLPLTDCGIATSGNYRNFHDTARYGRIGHTIDPSTGIPAHTDVISATVIASNTALADAWATACMASNAADALAHIGGCPYAECLLVIATDDSLCVRTSAGFPTPK